MPSQDAAAEEAAQAEHLRDWLGVDAPQTEIRDELFSYLVGSRPVSFMETKRGVELLECVPQRLVIGIMPDLPVGVIGAQEGGSRTPFVHDAARLPHRV